MWIVNRETLINIDSLETSKIWTGKLMEKLKRRIFDCRPDLMTNIDLFLKILVKKKNNGKSDMSMGNYYRNDKIIICI